MRSLRSRLVLGCALVAVVPLAVTTLLLARRVESTLRLQADQRLSAALGALRSELRGEGERVSEQLAILARDPQLRRRYLVPADRRDLAEYLRERRVLLGLDVLGVDDLAGTTVADAAETAPPPHAPGATGGDSSAAYGLAIVSGPDLVPTLIGRAPIRYDDAVHGVLRGGLRLDAAFLRRWKSAHGMDLELRDADGRISASTRAGTHATATPSERSGRIRIGGERYLTRAVPLEVGAAPYPSIAGFVSTAEADRAISTLRWTALGLGTIGLGLAVALGMMWAAQVSQPVERLAAFSERLARGEWEQPLAMRSVRELETLGAALDRMRSDLRDYRARLVTSERHAAWSEMARKVAHEVKNPLTPIAISIADLKRSHDLGRPDFPQVLDQAVRTIGDEVDTLKRLLQEFSDFARFPAPRFGPCAWRDLAADLRTLYPNEVAAGRLRVRDADLSFSADAGQIRQVLINLVKNGIEASPDAVVDVSAAADAAGQTLTVADTGPGLGDEERRRLFLPGFTTKAHGSGLGLVIVERIVNDHRGTIAVDSAPGSGTTVSVHLPVDPRATADAAPSSQRT